MTGYDVYKKACSLLGQGNKNSYYGGQKNEAVKDILNQVLCDLKLEEITDLSSPLRLSKKAVEAVVYGCCWLYAVTVRDKGCADLYCRLYNVKRTAILASTDTRSDVLPSVLGGA